MLIDEAGTRIALAERVDTPVNYINQLMTNRTMGRRFCERLEAEFKKQDGWMDQWLPEEMPTVSRETVRELVRHFESEHRKAE